MKTVFILSFILLFNFGFSQSIVIDVSKNDKIVLVFPADIIESTLGNSLSFIQQESSGNSKYSSRILKLSYNYASDKISDETNLDIITEDGLSYLFTVRFGKKINKYRWNFKVEDASYNLEGSLKNVGKNKNDSVSKIDIIKSNKPQYKLVESNEHKYSLDSLSDFFGSENHDVLKYREDSLYEYNRDRYYKTKCFYNTNNSSNVKRYFSRNDDIFLRLKGVFFDKGDLYFSLKIENKHSIDLEIDFINYYLATVYRKQSSNHETQIKPVYKYKQPKVVKGYDSKSFFLVFKKFVLEKKMVFRINLKEKNGSRIIELDIDRDLINHPMLF